MRGAFGLISLLLGISLMAYLWSNYTATVSNTQSVVVDQARQISGRDAEGKSALESIKTAGSNDAGGRLKSLLVVEIVPEGAMEKFYGLKKGDQITVAGDYAVETNNDAATANAMLLEAFKASKQLVVTRDGKEIALPIRSPVPPDSGLGGPPAKAIDDQVKQLQKQLGQ